MTSCSSSDKNKARGDLSKVEEENSTVYIYYVNRDETKISGEEYAGNTDIDSLLNSLESDPQDKTLKRTLGGEVTIKDSSVASGILVLDFDESYRSLSKAGEVLFRAAIVRTLCQSPQVESVVFNVDGESLGDSNEVPYGPMSADNFVDSGMDETGSYEMSELTLYFSNEAGDKLSAMKQTVAYSTNVAIEKIIVEQLLAGPDEEGYRATLSPDRVLNTISVKDGICYVDLSEPMVDLTGAVSEEVSVYSIVNSLTEISSINKVQISIDGETDRTYRGSMRLDKMYERNLDIIG